jgi:hypothetical protein
LALLAAVGFAALCGAVPWHFARRRAGLMTAVAIGASGLLFFDVVTPRLLRASSVGLLARAVAHGEPGSVAMLTAYRFRDGVAVDKHLSVDWLLNSHDYLPQILRAVPRQPVSTVFVEALERGDPDAARDTFFWTPALEYTAGIGERLCALWPGAALHTIEDEPGLSRVHALRPSGDDWKPAVPSDRWQVTPCAARRGLAWSRPRPSHRITPDAAVRGGSRST